MRFCERAQDRRDATTCRETATRIPSCDRVGRVASNLLRNIDRFAIVRSHGRGVRVMRRDARAMRWPQSDANAVGGQRSLSAEISDERSSNWPARQQSVGRRGQSLVGRCSGAAQSLRELSHVELVHLVLQRAQRNAEVLGRAGHVPAALLERAQDEVALEGVRRLLEQAVAAACPAARAARSETRAAGPRR